MTDADMHHLATANIKQCDNKVTLNSDKDQFDVIYLDKIYRVSVIDSHLTGRRIITIKYKTTEQTLGLPGIVADRLYVMLLDHLRGYGNIRCM